MSERPHSLKRFVSEVRGIRAALTAFEDALLRASVGVRALHDATAAALGAGSAAASNVLCGCDCLDASLIKAQAFHRALAEAADDALRRAAAVADGDAAAVEALWTERCGPLQAELSRVARCHAAIFAQLAEGFASLRLSARTEQQQPQQPPPVSRATKPQQRAAPSVLDLRELSGSEAQPPRRPPALHSRGQSLAALPVAASPAAAAFSPRRTELQLLRAEKLSAKKADAGAAQWSDVAPVSVQRPRVQAVQQRQARAALAADIRQLCARFDFVELCDDDDVGAAFFLRAARALASKLRALPSAEVRPARVSERTKLASPFSVSLRVSASGAKPHVATVSCDDSTTLSDALQAALKSAPAGFPSAAAHFASARICGTIECVDDFSVALSSLEIAQLCVLRGKTPCIAVEPRNDAAAKEEPLPRCTGVDFSAPVPPETVSVLPSCEVRRQFQIRVLGLENVRFSAVAKQHFPDASATYDSFKRSFEAKQSFEDSKLELFVEAKLFHGSSAGSAIPGGKMETAHKPQAFWVQWISCDVPFCNLPREARVQFTLYSLNTKTPNSRAIPVSQASVNVFDASGLLEKGVKMLRMEPLVRAPKKLGVGKQMTLSIEFEQTPHPVLHTLPPPPPSGSTHSEPSNAEKEKLRAIFRSNPLADLAENDKKLVVQFSEFAVASQDQGALLKLVRSVHWHDPIESSRIVHSFATWPQISTETALFMLGASCPVTEAREFALKRLEAMDDNELSRVLPQLVRSVLFCEGFAASALAEFLLVRALNNRVDIGQPLFWQLYAHTSASAPETRHRASLNLAFYIWACGRQRQDLIDQVRLVRQVENIALNRLPQTAVSERSAVLQTALRTITLGSKLSLPVAPRFRITALDIDRCRVVESQTLLLSFLNSESGPENAVDVVFRTGCIALDETRNHQVYYNCSSSRATLECTPTGATSALFLVEPGAVLFSAAKTEAGGLKRLLKILAAEDRGQGLQVFASTCAALAVQSFIAGVGGAGEEALWITKTGRVSRTSFETSAESLGGPMVLALPADFARVISEAPELQHHFVSSAQQAFISARRQALALALVSPNVASRLHADDDGTTESECCKWFTAELADALRKAC